MCYLFFYFLCIFPYCIHIVSSAPKLPISILILLISPPIVYHDTTFSFQVSLKCWYCLLWGYLHHHGSMFWTHCSFYDLYSTIFLVSLPSSLHRIRSVYIWGQILCDTCNSTSNVIDDVHHSFWMFSFWFFIAVGSRNFIFIKRSFIFLDL